MEEMPQYLVSTPTVFLDDVNTLSANTEWERELLEKIRQLQSQKKRAILFIDGDTILVFRAENLGVIKTD